MRHHVSWRSKIGRPNMIAHPRRSFPFSILASTSEALKVRRSTSSGALSWKDRTSEQTTTKSRSSEATPSRTADPTATIAKVFVSMRVRRRKPWTQFRARRVGQRRMERSACTRAATLSTGLAGLGPPPRSSRSESPSRRHQARVLRCRHRTRFSGFRSGRPIDQKRRQSHVYGATVLQRFALKDGLGAPHRRGVGMRHLRRFPMHGTHNDRSAQSGASHATCTRSSCFSARANFFARGSGGRHARRGSACSRKSSG